jgi:ComF family protein
MRRSFVNATSGALATLARLPAQCEVCRAWCSGSLCDDCRRQFAAPRSRCCSCSIGLAAGVDEDPSADPSRPGSSINLSKQCGTCLRHPPPFTLCFALTDYGFPWAGLIASLKFRDHPEIANLLARSMAEALTSQSWPLPQLLVPIPLGADRLRQRGYNQAWELTRRLARRLNLNCAADVLLRLRDTERQTGLSRAERERNLRNAFLVAPNAEHLLRDRHVALIDDVMTSGATATVASRALLRAGAARVDMWLLARTPMPQDRTT